MVITAVWLLPAAAQSQSPRKLHAVAPSDPNIVYVASGEGLHRPDLSVGDGIYKSTDAGKTWTHLGLREGQQIPQLAVDPRDPNKVFGAVAGHRRLSEEPCTRFDQRSRGSGAASSKLLARQTAPMTQRPCTKE
jgi:hypothetical protein